MKIVSVSELRAGDVLLCYGAAKLDPISKVITQVTNSNYTHAAICIDSYTAAESTLLGGVAKVKTQDLVNRYDHVAVLRQPDAWSSQQRVQAMNTFIDTIIASKAMYNLCDVVAFKERSEVHQLSLNEQVKAFFDGAYLSVPVVKGSYFCSELVVSCFVITGFIDPSAAVVFNAKVTSPGDLGRDPVYGTFYGYVTALPNYSVPVSDEFYGMTTFSEIFGSGA